MRTSFLKIVTVRKDSPVFRLFPSLSYSLRKKKVIGLGFLGWLFVSSSICGQSARARRQPTLQTSKGRCVLPLFYQPLARVLWYSGQHSVGLQFGNLSQWSCCTGDVSTEGLVTCFHPHSQLRAVMLRSWSFPDSPQHKPLCSSALSGAWNSLGNERQQHTEAEMVRTSVPSILAQVVFLSFLFWELSCHW